MAIICPYCEEEIGDEIHSAWAKEWVCGDGDYPVRVDIVCLKCGSEVEVDVEMKPIFVIHEAGKSEE